MAALLQCADAATRESMTTDLQARAGNTAVQRLVEMQRDPVAPTRTPIAAGPERRTPIRVGGSDASMAPTLDLKSSTAAKWMAQRMGEQYVEALPTVSPSDQALVARSNDYFQSSPLEWGEQSSGEHLKKRNELTDVFQKKAHQLTLHILSKSEQQAFREWMRYSEDPDTDNEAADQLRAAAAHLAKVQAELFEVATSDSAMMREATGTNSVLSRTTETLDDELDSLADQKPPDGDPTVEVRKAVLIVKDRYRALRDVYGQRFPILLPKNQDYAKVASTKRGELEAYAADRAKSVIKSTYEFREEFSPEKIWSLPVVIEQTKKLMGIENGTGANDAIEGKRDDIAWDKTVEKLGMAALQLGLSLVAAALTGGTSLAIQAAGAAAATGVAVVSGGQVAESWREYKFGKAAAGEISLDPAVRLASEEPSWGWLAFDIVMMVVDVAEVAAAFRAISASM
jgi:hypothetical protein